MFQYVSSNDWWGNPAAPWNQVKAHYVTCQECGGTGGVWFDEDGNTLSDEEYKVLSKEEQSLWTFDECMKCEGVGTIKIEDD